MSAAAIIRKMVSTGSGGNPAKRIQLFFLGDSITYGIGTTGTGQSNSGIVGPNTYPKQALTMLSDINVSSTIRGFSGQTQQWFNDNEMINTINMFRVNTFDIVACVVFFGANDICYPDKTAANIYSSIVACHTSLRAGGAKTIVVPILNRKDSYAQADTNSKRLAVNAMLSANWPAFADGFADLSLHPNIYADAAPDDPTYFASPDPDGLSKVHPTDQGAGLIATEVAAAIHTLAN
jgi:lysophospholipase L1-like esterase